MAEADESKYAHLLQPIRDLAGNWDINIADELEEYLVSFSNAASNAIAANFLAAFSAASVQEVLESVTFSFEEGPSLNFAEGMPGAQACEKVPTNHSCKSERSCLCSCSGHPGLSMCLQQESRVSAQSCHSGIAIHVREEVSCS